MSNFIEFNCPSCGRANLVDRGEVGPDGIVRACQGCGQQCFVSGSGETGASGADAAAGGGGYDEPLAELGGDDGYHLRMPNGRVEHLSADAIEHGIRASRVRPWDQVSLDGSHFQPISETEPFGSSFVDADFQATIARQCVNHAEAGPAATCSRCGRSYCAACVSELIRLEPRVCPACNGSVKDPDPRLAEKPLWERPKEVARIPIDGQAWHVPLVVGILYFVATWSVWTALLVLVNVAILFQVVRQAAKGAKTISLALEGDVKAFLAKTGPVILLAALMAVPLVALQLILPPVVAIFIQFPLSIAILIYFPMAVGLLALESPKGMEPRSVLNAIVALRENYLLALLLLIAVGIAVVAAQTLVSFLPFLGRLLGSLALGYGSVLQAYILGWLVYMNRERILAAA